MPPMTPSHRDYDDRWPLMPGWYDNTRLPSRRTQTIYEAADILLANNILSQPPHVIAGPKLNVTLMALIAIDRYTQLHTATQYTRAHTIRDQARTVAKLNAQLNQYALACTIQSRRPDRARVVPQVYTRSIDSDL